MLSSSILTHLLRQCQSFATGAETRCNQSTLNSRLAFALAVTHIPQMSNLIESEVVDLTDAFVSQVRQNPSLIAVIYNEMSISYEEIDTYARRIGAAIKQATSVPSPRVLVATPTSPWAYAGVIGTLYVGGTFCPINIDGPETRNATITRVFSPDAILFENTPPLFLGDSLATTPRIDISKPGTNCIESLSSDYSDIAYVIFTSGSTGQPKGVKIGRAGFSHFLSTASKLFKVTRGERWAQFSNLGYDLAIMDI